MKTEKEIREGIKSLEKVATNATWSFVSDGALIRISMLRWVLGD